MPEKTPASSDNNPNTVAEQIPHSGVGGHEQPVFDFPGHNLKEAVEQRDLHVGYDEEGRVIVPDSLGDHIDPTQSDRTDVYTPLTPPVEAAPSTTEKTSNWKRWIALVGGGAVLVGGGAVVGKAMSSGDNSVEPRSDQSTSALPNTSEESSAPETNVGTETTGEAIIAGLNKKATPEQVEYVINNPVNVAEAPTVGDAFAALSDRFTVVMNSGEPDLDAPAGEIVFTPETQASYDAMGPSIMDVTSPYYDAMLDSLRARRNQIGAMFMLDANAETEANLLPVSDADTPLQAGSSIDVTVNTVWTTNQPDNRTNDGKYNNDHSSTMTLSVDAAGNIRIYNSTDVKDIGNIG